MVKVWANGETCAHVKADTPVTFTAEAEVPNGAGIITEAQWSFEGSEDFLETDSMELYDGGQRARLTAEHTFEKKGTYFAVCRVASERNGNRDDMFTQVRNLERVRVIVE